MTAAWWATLSNPTVRTLSAAEWAALPTYPRNGSFISASGKVYSVAGGAPVYVSTWNVCGGS